MARAGINKAHVLQAREVLLSRGINPSIDAIRNELGNTGSKSTIHRYLREIEQEQGARLDDEALLSDTLKEMVARLAARLREEAGLALEVATDEHARLWECWKAREAHLEEEITELKRLGLKTEGEYERAQKYGDHMDGLLQKERIETQRLGQQVIDLQEQLADRETHRQSLEEKHQHARDALEHYRQSVKEQREQELRRHEQQLQSIQAELRQLQQTLIVKQNDITQLNKDNARLVSELGSLNKQFSRFRVDYQVAQDTSISLREKSVQLESRLESKQQREQELRQELGDIRQQFDRQTEQVTQSAVSLAKAEMLAQTQGEMIVALQRKLKQAHEDQ